MKDDLHERPPSLYLPLLTPLRAGQFPQIHSSLSISETDRVGNARKLLPGFAGQQTTVKINFNPRSRQRSNIRPTLQNIRPRCPQRPEAANREHRIGGIGSQSGKKMTSHIVTHPSVQTIQRTTLLRLVSPRARSDTVEQACLESGLPSKPTKYTAWRFSQPKAPQKAQSQPRSRRPNC